MRTMDGWHDGALWRTHKPPDLGASGLWGTAGAQLAVLHGVGIKHRLHFCRAVRGQHDYTCNFGLALRRRSMAPVLAGLGEAEAWPSARAAVCAWIVDLKPLLQLMENGERISVDPPVLPRYGSRQLCSVPESVSPSQLYEPLCRRPNAGVRVVGILTCMNPRHGCDAQIEDQGFRDVGAS